MIYVAGYNWGWKSQSNFDTTSFSLYEDSFALENVATQSNQSFVQLGS